MINMAGDENESECMVIDDVPSTSRNGTKKNETSSKSANLPW